MKFDPRIGAALLFTLFLEAASAFMWAGQASARLTSVEARLEASPEIAERLARLEEQMTDARRSLGRIEARLDRHDR